MPRAFELYLRDVIKAAHFIEKQVEGLSYTVEVPALRRQIELILGELSTD